MALSVGLRCSIRSIVASITSVGESCFFPMARANSPAPMYEMSMPPLSWMPTRRCRIEAYHTARSAGARFQTGPRIGSAADGGEHLGSVGEDRGDGGEDPDDHSQCRGQSESEREGAGGRGLLADLHAFWNRVEPDGFHDPGVVVEGYDGVHGGDDRQDDGASASGEDDRPEHHELGEPAGERRDAGERQEEHGSEDTEAGVVAAQSGPVVDLSTPGGTGAGDDDGERPQVHQGVD